MINFRKRLVPRSMPAGISNSIVQKFQGGGEADDQQGKVNTGDYIHKGIAWYYNNTEPNDSTYNSLGSADKAKALAVARQMWGEKANLYNNLSSSEGDITDNDLDQIAEKAMQFELSKGAIDYKGGNTVSHSNYGWNSKAATAAGFNPSSTATKEEKESLAKEKYIENFLKPLMAEYKDPKSLAEAAYFKFSTGRDPKIYAVHTYQEEKGIAQEERGGLNADKRRQLGGFGKYANSNPTDWQGNYTSKDNSDFVNNLFNTTFGISTVKVASDETATGQEEGATTTGVDPEVKKEAEAVTTTVAEENGVKTEPDLITREVKTNRIDIDALRKIVLADKENFNESGELNSKGRTKLRALSSIQKTQEGGYTYDLNKETKTFDILDAFGNVATKDDTEDLGHGRSVVHSPFYGKVRKKTKERLAVSELLGLVARDDLYATRKVTLQPKKSSTSTTTSGFDEDRYESLKGSDAVTTNTTSGGSDNTVTSSGNNVNNNTGSGSGNEGDAASTDDAEVVVNTENAEKPETNNETQQPTSGGRNLPYTYKPANEPFLTHEDLQKKWEEEKAAEEAAKKVPEETKNKTLAEEVKRVFPVMNRLYQESGLTPDSFKKGDWNEVPFKERVRVTNFISDYIEATEPLLSNSEKSNIIHKVNTYILYGGKAPEGSWNPSKYRPKSYTKEGEVINKLYSYLAQVQGAEPFPPTGSFDANSREYWKQKAPTDEQMKKILEPFRLNVGPMKLKKGGKLIPRKVAKHQKSNVLGGDDPLAAELGMTKEEFVKGPGKYGTAKPFKRLTADEYNLLSEDDKVLYDERLKIEDEKQFPRKNKNVAKGPVVSDDPSENKSYIVTSDKKEVAKRSKTTTEGSDKTDTSGGSDEKTYYDENTGEQTAKWGFTNTGFTSPIGELFQWGDLANVWAIRRAKNRLVGHVPVPLKTAPQVYQRKVQYAQGMTPEEEAQINMKIANLKNRDLGSDPMLNTIKDKLYATERINKELDVATTKAKMLRESQTKEFEDENQRLAQIVEGENKIAETQDINREIQANAKLKALMAKKEREDQFDANIVALINNMASRGVYKAEQKRQLAAHDAKTQMESNQALKKSLKLKLIDVESELAADPTNPVLLEKKDQINKSLGQLGKESMLTAFNKAMKTDRNERMIFGTGLKS